jgi:hypothetical protein
MSKKEILFTYFSDGNSIDFNPFSYTICPFQKNRRMMLDVYRDLVAFRASPTVFILDNTGKPL